jgi:hypothetical protein
MKEDSLLIAIVFLVWAALSALYYTVPMIYMPTSGRVWGLGALLFLVLGGLIALAERRRKGHRGAND